MAAFLLVSTYAFAQNTVTAFAQNTVTGIVKDQSGLPLVGVNVVEKGTTNGNITDVNGKYSVNVERGKTLVFSYIGFITQEIRVNSNTINVTLAEELL